MVTIIIIISPRYIKTSHQSPRPMGYGGFISQLTPGKSLCLPVASNAICLRPIGRSMPRDTLTSHILSPPVMYVIHQERKYYVTIWIFVIWGKKLQIAITWCEMGLNVYFTLSVTIWVLISSFLLPTPPTHSHEGKPLSWSCHHITSVNLPWQLDVLQDPVRCYLLFGELLPHSQSCPGQISGFLICVPTNLEEPLVCPLRLMTPSLSSLLQGRGPSRSNTRFGTWHTHFI